MSVFALSGVYILIVFITRLIKHYLISSYRFEGVQFSNTCYWAALSIAFIYTYPTAKQLTGFANR